jgi:hypothetical protein
MPCNAEQRYICGCYVDSRAPGETTVIGLGSRATSCAGGQHLTEHDESPGILGCSNYGRFGQHIGHHSPSSLVPVRRQGLVYFCVGD